MANGLRIIAALPVIIVLAGCDSSEAPAPRFVLEGEIRSSVVSDANVEIYLSDGSLLGSTTSNDEGVFTIEVAKAPVYVVKASEGKIEGTDFKGQLSAICDRSPCVVSPFSSVIERMVGLHGFSVGDAKAHVQSVSGLASDPFEKGYEAQDGFDLSSVRLYLSKGKQLDTWVGDFIAWVTGAFGGTRPVGFIPGSGQFVKLDSDGEELAKTSDSWSCVEDLRTGLQWEVKTLDGGLRDTRHRYSWFDPNPATNGGDPGRADGGNCVGSKCDTNAFAAAVNAIGLCGANDWRVPTIDELKTVTFCTNNSNLSSLVPRGKGCGDYSMSYDTPTKDLTAFPLTAFSAYWSSTPGDSPTTSRFNAFNLWVGAGLEAASAKGQARAVRLVRDAN